MTNTTTLKHPPPEPGRPSTLWVIDVNAGAYVEGPMSYDKAMAVLQELVRASLSNVTDLEVRPADAHTRGQS